MKKNYLFLIVVIIISSILLALYLNTNSNKGKGGNLESDNSQNLSNLTITKKENETSAGISPTIINNNLNTNLSGNSTTPERKLSVYIDKNSNGIKDADETLCTLCTGEQLLFGKTGNKGNFPIVSNIKNLGLDTSGSIKESALQSADIAWGAFEDKDFIVATSQIAFGDGSGDNFIPAYEYSAKIAGVNANISDIQDVDGETQYSFKTLVPIMQTSLQQSKTVYIKYSLNPDDTKYYISSGKITSAGPEYYFKTKWNIEQSLKSGSLSSLNISFYCL